MVFNPNFDYGENPDNLQTIGLEYVDTPEQYNPEDDWLPSPSGKVRKAGLSPEDEAFLTDIKSLTDEELNALTEEEAAYIESFLNRVEGVDTPTQEPIQEPVQAASVGNPLLRAGEVFGRSVMSPFEMLYGLGKQGADAITADPMGALGEVLGTGYAAFDMATPFLGESTRVNPLTRQVEDTNNWKNQLGKAMGINVKDYQDAFGAGTIAAGKSLADGIGSLGSDIYNAADYILTGNRSGSAKPLFKTPELPADVGKSLQQHPLAALAPQFAALAVASKLGGKLGKPATTLKAEALKEAVAGSAVGGVLDPGKDVKDPVERIAMRSGDALLTGGIVAGGKALQKIDSTLKSNKSVRQVADPLGIPREEAKKLLNKNPNMQPTQIANTLKQATQQLKDSKKGAFRLSPEQTAQATTASGKAQKGAIAVGTQQEITNALVSRGMEPQKAAARYIEFDTARKSTTHYKAREVLDREIMSEMGVNSVEAPKGGARKMAMGGDVNIEEARKAARKQAIKKISDVTGLPPKEAIKFSQKLTPPTEFTGTSETLTPRQAAQAKLGLLPEGNLARTTQSAGRIFDEVKARVPVAQKKIGDARQFLNDTEIQLSAGLAGLSEKNPLLKWPVVREATKDYTRLKGALTAENVVEDGRLADAMKGDYSRLTTEEARVVVPVAKKLVEFNENVLIPQIRKIYGMNDLENLTLEDFATGLVGKVEDAEIETKANKYFDQYQKGKLTEEELIDLGAYVKLDPYHISNVQNGEMVHKVNVTRAKKYMTKDELNSLGEKYSVGVEGKDPILLFGYYDSQVDLVNHLEKNTRYRTEYPWLFEKGKVRTDLITSEVNNMKVVSDLEYSARLDKSQLQRLRERKPQFVQELVAQGAGTAKELNILLDDMIRQNNVKDPNAPYRRFVGSLQTSEGKLLTQNVNPFKTMYSQAVALAKRTELEPVVNKLITERQKLEEKLANRSQFKTPQEYSLTQAEVHWYKDLEAQYRGQPSQIDIALNDAMDAGFAALPEPLKKYISPKYSRTAADYFLAAESLMRLGGNFSASLFNVAEAIRNGLPELSPKGYLRLADNLGLIPFKDGKFRPPTQAIVDTINDMKRHPAAEMLLTGRQTDAGLNSTFGTSQRMFGSYTIGGIRDGLMLPFEAGTTLGKALSYNIFKATGEDLGLTGKALDDYIITQMAHTGSMPEMSKLPLTSRSKVASIALLFKNYLIRLADNEWHYMEQALGPNATYDDIYKSVMFSVAPVMMVGVQTSPTLMLASSLVNSAMGITQGGQDRASWEDVDRAKGGLATSGLVGTTTGLNTKAFRADLGSLLDVGGSLPVTEYENALKFANDLFEAQRIRTKAQEGMVVDGQPIDTVAAGNQMAADALINYGRSLSTLGNRAANSVDVVATGGQVRDRQGNIIETVPEKDIPITAAEELIGLRSKEREQAQATFNVLKKEQGAIEKLERSTKSKLQQWANKEDPFSPENLNTYYTLQSSYATQTGDYLSADKLSEWLGKSRTKIQSLWDSLSPTEQYSMLQNDRIKPLLDAYGLSPVEEQGVDNATL